MIAAYGAPGVGGSLGCCCYCGEAFTLAIMTGSSVRTIRITGFSGQLSIHDACMSALAALIARDPKDWRALPEKSPVRQAFVLAHEAKP